MDFWAKLSDILKLRGQMLQEVWKCELPPRDSLPSPALERAVDAWAAKLAANLPVDPNPPPEVQPWLVARLAVSSAFCRTLAKRGEAGGSKLTPAILRALLVDEWREHLRNDWTLGMKLDE